MLFANVPPTILGLYMQLASTFCVSLMALVAKVAGRKGLPVMEIVLSRSLVLLGLSTGMLARKGDPTAWPWRSERRALLLLRGLLGFTAVSCLYWAVQLLPLSDVAVLTFLAPVFVAAGAPLLLGERAGCGVALAMPLCVAGVALVSQPTFLFGIGAVALPALGVAVAIAQAASSAAAKLCIRSLGSTEPVGTIIFAMAAVSSVGSAALCALLPHHFVVPPSAAAWGLLLAAGLLGCGVQLLATAALKLSKAAPTIAMSYMAVVWGMGFDLAFFHHTPNKLSLLGAALVCGSSFIIVHFEQRRCASSSSSSSRSGVVGGSFAGPLELAGKPGHAVDAEAAPLVAPSAPLSQHHQQQDQWEREQVVWGSGAQLEPAQVGSGSAGTTTGTATSRMLPLPGGKHGSGSGSGSGWRWDSAAEQGDRDRARGQRGGGDVEAGEHVPLIPASWPPPPPPSPPPTKPPFRPS